MFVFRVARFSICFVALCISLYATGQEIDSLPLTDTTGRIDITVSYSIKVVTSKTNGIAESYTGGAKTIFVSGSNARIRLVSLMRIQSVFWLKSKTKKTIAVVKESGKDKYRYYLSPAQWKQYTKKQDSITYTFLDDSTRILNYTCRKALLTLKDGKTITAFYTSNIRNEMFGIIEPAFAGIPGLVLQYEYKNEKGVSTYTAVDISARQIASNVFQIPSAGYQTRKFFAKPLPQKNDTQPSVRIEDESEEENKN